jgi:predicted HicB family RNase H-like nuclease
MPWTEAKQKANQKYRDKFVYLQARTTEEYRNTINEHIKKTGESLNGFILRAINETISRDQNK